MSINNFLQRTETVVAKMKNKPTRHKETNTFKVSIVRFSDLTSSGVFFFNLSTRVRHDKYLILISAVQKIFGTSFRNRCRCFPSSSASLRGTEWRRRRNLLLSDSTEMVRSQSHRRLHSLQEGNSKHRHAPPTAASQAGSYRYFDDVPKAQR